MQHVHHDRRIHVHYFHIQHCKHFFDQLEGILITLFRIADYCSFIIEKFSDGSKRARIFGSCHGMYSDISSPLRMILEISAMLPFVDPISATTFDVPEILSRISGSMAQFESTGCTEKYYITFFNCIIQSICLINQSRRVTRYSDAEGLYQHRLSCQRIRVSGGQASKNLL